MSRMMSAQMLHRAVVGAGSAGLAALLTSIRAMLVAAAIAPAAIFAAPLQDVSCPAPTPAETAIYKDANDPAFAKDVALTEQYHFTADVENLVRGSSAEMPMDIDFTLRHHPNHYRALWAMARWQQKHRIPAQFAGKALPSECYFQRAFSFRPEDPQLRIIHAMALQNAGRLTDAQSEYERAGQMGASSAEYYYNRGLLEVDLGHLAKAQEYADKAYAMGYPLPGLKNKLAAARKAKP